MIALNRVFFTDLGPFFRDLGHFQGFGAFSGIWAFLRIQGLFQGFRAFSGICGLF